MTQPQLPANKIAFILDGKVLDVLHVDGRLAAILLSEPQIADATTLYQGREDGFNILNWDYNGTDFTPSEIITVMQ